MAVSKIEIICPSECPLFSSGVARLKACNIYVAFALSGGGDVPRGLDAQQHLHIDAEGLLDAKRHFGGTNCLLVYKIGMRGTPGAKGFRGLGHLTIGRSKIPRA